MTLHHRKNARAGLDVRNLHRVRDIRAVLHLHQNGQLTAGDPALAELRAKLNQKQARLPRGRTPLRNVGKTTHLLQQFHDFYFSSHTSVSRL